MILRLAHNVSKIYRETTLFPTLFSYQTTLVANEHLIKQNLITLF